MLTDNRYNFYTLSILCNRIKPKSLYLPPFLWPHWLVKYLADNIKHATIEIQGQSKLFCNMHGNSLKLYFCYYMCFCSMSNCKGTDNTMEVVLRWSRSRSWFYDLGEDLIRLISTQCNTQTTYNNYIELLRLFMW